MAEFESSGLGQNEFCRKEGLALSKGIETVESQSFSETSAVGPKTPVTGSQQLTRLEIRDFNRG